MKAVEPDAAGQADAPADDQQQAVAAAAEETATVVEAILFASDTPLPASRIAQAAELISQRVVHNAVRLLNERYEKLASAFRIESIAGGYQMLTQPQYHDVLSRLLSAKSDSRLTQAAMETLSIVAYRQPILRADIEAIRGVASGEVLRGLMDKQLVKIVGRAEVLGRPMLYGTTRRFLEVFGLKNLDDLPRAEELRGGDREKPASPPAAPAKGDGPAETPEPAEAPRAAGLAEPTPGTEAAPSPKPDDSAAQ